MIGRKASAHARVLARHLHDCDLHVAAEDRVERWINGVAIRAAELRLPAPDILIERAARFRNRDAGLISAIAARHDILRDLYFVILRSGLPKPGCGFRRFEAGK